MRFVFFPGGDSRADARVALPYCNETFVPRVPDGILLGGRRNRFVVTCQSSEGSDSGVATCACSGIAFDQLVGLVEILKT